MTKFLSKIDNNKRRVEEYSIKIQLQNLTEDIIKEVSKIKLGCIVVQLDRVDSIYFENGSHFNDNVVIWGDNIYFKSYHADRISRDTEYTELYNLLNS